MASKIVTHGILFGTVMVMGKKQKPTLEERKDLMCKPEKYGLEFMENRRLQNKFCMMHAPRTCCDHHDAEKIKNQYNWVKHETLISEQCLSELQNAMCSHCDPDMVSILKQIITPNFAYLLVTSYRVLHLQSTMAFVLTTVTNYMTPARMIYSIHQGRKHTLSVRQMSLFAQNLATKYRTGRNFAN